MGSGGVGGLDLGAGVMILAEGGREGRGNAGSDGRLNPGEGGMRTSWGGEAGGHGKDDDVSRVLASGVGRLGGAFDQV
jgi:hypothetical protein